MFSDGTRGFADSGNSHFTMNDGSLTNKQGHLFHVTNTNAIISLNNVKLVNEDPAKVLLSVCACPRSAQRDALLAKKFSVYAIIL